MEEAEPILEEPIPEMTHNVFGLDHSKIMNRLLAARKKTRDAWNSLHDDTVITYRATKETKSQPIMDVGKQKNELADFLIKRQV